MYNFDMSGLDLEAVGSRLSELVEKDGRSHRAICLDAKVNTHYLKRLLDGDVRSPTYANIAAIAEQLGTTPEWILEGRKSELPEDEDLAAIIRLWDHIPASDRKTLRNFGEGIQRKANED